MSSETDVEEQRLLRRKKKASEAGNLLLLAEACRKLGEMYHEQSEHRKALIEYKLVAKAFQNLKMQMELGRAHRMIGEQFNMLGEFEKALQYDRSYLDIAKQEKDHVEVQRAHVTIGRTFLMKGQSCEKLEKAMEPLMEAERSFERSLKLSRELKSIGRLEQVDMEARSLLNLGVTKEHQGNWEQATECMQKATKLAENNDLTELLHQCYTTSALLFNSKLNNHARALKALSEALEVASRLQNKATKMCETLITKADILIKTGDFQSARQALKQAYKLRTPVAADAENIERRLKVLVAVCRVEDELIMTGSEEYTKKKGLYERMGDGACKLENYSKAIDYYLKMLECAQLAGEADRDLIPIYVSLYQTYKDNKQYDDALVYLWQEYELIDDDPEEAYNTLLNIADVFEAQKKPWNEVDEIYQRARAQAKKLKSVPKERVAIKRCVAMLKRQGMEMMAERLEKEAAGMGMDLENSVAEDSDDSDTQDETETSIEYAINSLEIGEDVDLAELSNSDDERPKALDKSLEGKNTRKRGTTFKVKKNNKGESQLHQACIGGNFVLVQKLLDQGHPVNVRDNAGWLPLHEACIHGHKEIVDLLLDRGAYINDKGGTSCDGITPLYDACSNGNLEVVELLLDRGANCTQRTDSGDTTLNVLQLWFEGVQKKLAPEIISYYNTIFHRIKGYFDVAAVKPDESATVPDAILNASQPAGRSTRRRPIQPIRSGSESGNEEPRSARSTVRNSAKQPSKRRPLPEVRSDSSGLSSDSEPEEQIRPRATKPGVFDYQTAIEAVRKRTNAQLSPLKDPNPAPSKRTAHMRREEVGDDWLVADVNPATKRQKFLSDKDYSEPSVKSSRRSLEDLVSPQKSIASSNGSNRVRRRSVSLDPAPDANQILMGASNRSFSRAPSNQSKSHRQSVTGSNRYQGSLLEAGFSVSSRSVGSNGSAVDDPEDVRTLMSPSKESVASSSGDNRLSGMTTTTTPGLVLPPSMVRVLVDGDQIDVDYEQDQEMGLSVGWLAEEVAKRYGIKHGKRPMLKLMRSDNSLCMDSEPLTTVLEKTDPVIKSYVIEYTSLRGDQFYEDSCRLRDLEPVTALMSALNLMENTGKLALKRDFFAGTTRQFDVLFQAIGCQGSTRELNLSMNQLTDAELQGFVEKLPVLKNLERLNLAMNPLTQKSIFSMSTKLASLPDMIYMTELDLSRCSLLDQSMPQLASICQRMPQLRVLRLASTMITNLTYGSPPLEVSRLQVLDVSENSLNKKSIEYMFAKLDMCILTELNVCKLGLLAEFKPNLTVAIQTKEFDMLSTLNLSQCGLTDDELSTLLVPLRSSAGKLKLLDVSFNRLLTQKSFVEVFRTLNTHSLEMVRFAENPLVLKGLSDALMDDIQYDRARCYPYAVDLMRPLRLGEPEAKTLLDKLTDFWEQLWKERGAVSMTKSTVSLRQKHYT